MKKLLVLTSLLFLLVQASAFAYQHVSGYTRSNGTYVNSYYRSDPDSTQTNNWSTEGNVNPFTGEAGHRRAQY